MKNIETLQIVAKKLGINPLWLDRVIKHESNWNSLAVGKVPSSQGHYPKGLIQFTDSTARGLGFKDAQDIINRYPDVESQLLNPVFLYLDKLKPFKDEGDFYLSIFLPIARKMGRNQLLPEKYRTINKGINTPQDYINRVKGIIKSENLTIVIILFILLVAYFIYN